MSEADMSDPADARLPILRVRPKDVPRAVLVVGDPDRAAMIAGLLDRAEEIGRYREYVSYRAMHRGSPVGIVSHGVGAAGAGICFDELCRAGVRTIVRAGTAGGMQDNVRDGHVVVASAAVRNDGFTEQLVPLGYPAVPSRRLTGALADGAAAGGLTVHEGVVLTGAIFYPLDVLGSDLELWQRAGVVAVEMECAALFVIAAQHAVEAAAILTIDGNPLASKDTTMAGYDPHRASVRSAVEATVRVALDALIA